MNESNKNESNEIKNINQIESQMSEDIVVSRWHKINMNRIFREYGGCKWIPYPEVDNLFERIRSKVVACWIRRRPRSR